MAVRRVVILAVASLTVGLIWILSARSARADQIMSMDQWLNMTEHQGTIAPGTKITLQNWQQYKQFMPPGMIALFEGRYFWKMPQDVEIDVGPTINYPLNKSYIDATERYAGTARLIHKADGRYGIEGYMAGDPFPHPSGPDEGMEWLADMWFGPGGYIGVHSPETGLLRFCGQDRFANIACTAASIVYRRLAFNNVPTVPRVEPLANGMYGTAWLMMEEPEQSKYTASLGITWQDPSQDQDLYVFVPSMRRSLRLSITARCAPLAGSDMTNDDQNRGYNAGIGIMQAKYLGERKILAQTEMTPIAGLFPDSYDMPLGWPKASWGPWSLQPAVILDIRRIPSEAGGYCYGKRIRFMHKRWFYMIWTDLYDANMKFWKAARVSYGPLTDPATGYRYPSGIYIEEWWDVQNDHATYTLGCDQNGRCLTIDGMVPKKYLDIPRFSTPGGLMQIMK